MPYFTIHKINNHVFHIYEPLDVGMTLITGKNRALLFDTGFGVGNIAAEVAAITDLPLTVLNSHGHYDHAGGNYQFDCIQAAPSEKSVIAKYTAPSYFAIGVNLAKEREILPDEFAAYGNRQPEKGAVIPFEGTAIDLGGLTVEIIPMKGHTPGSTGLLIREDRLLLVGDNWNPQTWVFFPECETVPVYRETIRNILALPFDRVLCPHTTAVRARADLEAYSKKLDSLSLETSRKIVIPPYENIDTYAYPADDPGCLIYDAKKVSTSTNAMQQ